MREIIVVCCGKAGSEKAGRFPARIRDPSEIEEYARMKEGQQPQADAAPVPPVEQKRACWGNSDIAPPTEYA